MIMKHKFKIFTSICALSLYISSCDKKIEEAHLNPNAPVRVPIEELLPGVLTNMHANSSAQGSAYGPANDGLYIGRYVQFWATNTAGNQFDQMGGATGGSDLLGGVWAGHYYGMGQNLNRIIEWGTEEKKWDYVGVGYAIRAWSWLTLTNMHGEVILKEAFNASQQVFKYDEQKEVYDEVRRLCRLAIENLNKTGDGVSQTNLAKGDRYFYNGNVAKWKKFTYSIMARSFNHLTNKAEYQPDSVLFYANMGINANADNATIKFENSGISGTKNFYGPFRGNAGALRQTKFIADLLNGTNSRFNGVNDPRAAYLIRENTNGTYRGVEPNRGSADLATADQPQNFWGGVFTTTAAANDANARYIFKDGAPFPVITASEVQFMKAEAWYRKGNKAEALNAYREGISLSFDLLTSDYNASVPTARQITPATKATYLANPVVVPTAANLTLSHIMLQKYIAMYGWGAIETWTDIRRYHYTDAETGVPGQVYADFTPPTGTNLFVDNNQKWVYRARPRFNSEYLYNVPELSRIGALALDYHTREQWFSQK